MAKQTIVTTDDSRTKSVTFKFPVLPQHVPYQQPYEIMITDKISIEEGEDEQAVKKKMEASRRFMLEEFRDTVLAIESDPFIMQRLCKDPEVLPTTGNNNGTTKRVPMEHFVTEPIMEDPPVEPEDAKKVMVQTIMETMRAMSENGRKPVKFLDLRKKTIDKASSEELSSIISELVDMQILIEGPMGVLRLPSSQPGTEPPTERPTTPDQAGRISDTPKETPYTCPFCKKVSTTLMLGPKGECPFCGKGKDDAPAGTPNGNGTVDGSTLMVLDHGQAICPLCLDMDRKTALMKGDLNYSTKMRIPVALCFNHRKEWFGAKDTPKVRESLIQAYRKSMDKYVSEGMTTEAVQ